MPGLVPSVLRRSVSPAVTCTDVLAGYRHSPAPPGQPVPSSPVPIRSWAAHYALVGRVARRPIGVQTHGRHRSLRRHARLSRVPIPGLAWRRKPVRGNVPCGRQTARPRRCKHRPSPGPTGPDRWPASPASLTVLQLARRRRSSHYAWPRHRSGMPDACANQADLARSLSECWLRCVMGATVHYPCRHSRRPAGDCARTRAAEGAGDGGQRHRARSCCPERQWTLAGPLVTSVRRAAGGLPSGAC